MPAETQHQQQWNSVPGSDNIQQAGRWLVKVQLAHYCLTGIYPTWLHRFSGHNLISSEPSRIQFKPGTSRLLGLLLGAQVVATMIQASSTVASRWLLHQQQRRQSRDTSQQVESAPAIAFKSGSDQDLAVVPSTVGNSICSICKMERKHPSAPSCGHVFCWKCLLHWVSAIRPECPLCRAPCRPQDVVALYNYEPGNFST